ncbi:ABC transporter substrate-binding protein [Marinobacterium sp. D7]|uniref:ABC transporter substrate-binding protein n=1 Tax=Marinobacterium ramblicola TaxID=2849041 RepID=UPI001C2DCC5C|nr:ABC transporter substrate-binding protein [Marinobacterium ramblicola]MBV1789864.1 ABC transporter substrate-binding protein [Marinobacterium ramblicola]
MLKQTTIGLVLATLLPSALADANEPLDIRVAYVGQIIDRGPVLSNLIPEPEDAGLQGARLAIADSNSTGRFLKHQYRLDEIEGEDTATLVAESQALYDDGARLFVLNTAADTLAALSQALPPDALLINSGSRDDSLRSEQCLPGMLHTLPSRAMLADALAQWLIMRRWNRWMLISGSTDDDLAFAESIKRAAKRFGGKVVAEKAWSFDTDLRRTAQKELPPFTSGTEYDVLVVADERGDFGEYLPYNTGLPRPVVGTQGLMPVGWHKMIEAWGAAQLHSRFEKQSGRWMNEKDYASWAAVRTFAEAVTRTGSTDVATLRAFVLSDRFELAAFKGRKLNFRHWSGQLRQPVALVHPRALVSSSPQEGFLHPVTDLDTLGFDAPESRCRVVEQ